MPNTAIDGIVFVLDAGAINLCILLEPISLIPREELKKVQKSFENELPEIQLLVVEQKKSSFEEKNVDIENLLAKNSPVILKKGNTPG
ncbi:hypothetical protein G9A89_021272 [Geosiphon pyriformis]|nr:hypothetical protein G9A89_021272 [Geosiphon pyriformis]